MEVHISNVPQQSTENNLKAFLKEKLSKLSISSFNCQKAQGKPFASLTFLNIADAEKFLDRYGQSQAAPKQKPTPMSSKSVNLNYLGRPIYCSKSHREAHPMVLRNLAKEEKDRKTKAAAALPTTDHSKPEKKFPVSFNCVSFSCGVWNYVGSDLAYEPQQTWEVNGTAKFGERSMILALDSGLRIDFTYFSTLCITTDERSAASFIFSMKEPPRFFQRLNDPLAELMAGLGLQQRPLLPRNLAQRIRLPCIDEEHKSIAGSCLVYRIALARTVFIHDRGESVGDRMQILRTAHGVPRMIHNRSVLRLPRETFMTGFQKLQMSLASTAVDIPFILKFQIQKLAQDSYLSPHTVLKLLPEIRDMKGRTDISACVSAIRKLFYQIEFPGPDTEATEFELDQLIELLQENEKLARKESLIIEEEEPRASDNVAIIHRAKVTPTGIRLFGPEPESNNRVLRKYPKHHEYFLRVQFCDEDGQPVRFNPRISNDRIFKERFKNVLEYGIHIAGREYAFLGFSHSSLRAQSCWFMAPFIFEGSLMYDRMIIQDLGNFSAIRSPAKCAARIGQVFSDTRTAVRIDTSVVKQVRDVQFNGRVFSDGVGTMSYTMMETIWNRLSKARLAKPTLFQIRFKGISIPCVPILSVLKLLELQITFA